MLWKSQSILRFLKHYKNIKKYNLTFSAKEGMIRDLVHPVVKGAPFCRMLLGLEICALFAFKVSLLIRCLFQNLSADLALL